MDKLFPKEKPLIRSKAKYRALMKLKKDYPSQYRMYYLRELTPMLELLENDSSNGIE